MTLLKTQKELLEELRILWEKYPSMRFGQLLENYLYGCRSCLFHRGDEETVVRLRKLRDGL